jgi:LPS sulfotransferase NodH
VEESREKLFAEYLDFPRGTRPTLPYLIFATQRSGSTMLCSLLAATRLAGSPLEYFSEHNLGLYAKKHGRVAVDAYLNEIIGRRTSPNGSFGLKLMPEQLGHVFGKTSDHGDGFVRSYKRFVRITRRDKVEQAISMMLALERNVWHAEHPSERPQERTFRSDDVVTISRWVATFAAREQFWDALHARLGLPPVLDIAYEDLITDTPREVARVLHHLDLDFPAAAFPTPATLKLAGEGSQNIKRAYLGALGLAVAKAME